MEPSGELNILSSRSFFSDPQDTSVVYTGAREFEIKGDYLIIVEEDKDKPEPEPTKLDPLDFHVSQV